MHQNSKAAGSISTRGSNSCIFRSCSWLGLNKSSICKILQNLRQPGIISVIFSLATLVLINECKAQLNCIHDPTFRQPSVVSSSGVCMIWSRNMASYPWDDVICQRDGIFLWQISTVIPIFKAWLLIFICHAYRQRHWPWWLLVVMTLGFPHAITCLVPHSRVASENMWLTFNILNFQQL
jgi:hypothetical protein